jgi:3-oxoacyl-[acyl-carrier protein] reductase
METGLRDRVAIVAGSSQGIGRATAMAFAAEGAHLALCARGADGLKGVAEEASSRFGVRVLTGAFDVADDKAVRSFAARTHEHFGRLDVCVTNAGGPPPKPFLSTTMEDWERAWQLNLRSIVSFAQAVLPHMQQQKWGRIVTITSVTVKQPIPELVLSNSVRAGVMGLVRSLAGQFGRDGITINNVGPGFTATERAMEVIAIRAEKLGVTLQVAERKLCDDIPIGRMATPEEVGETIVWLASERAANITGQTILVDGGTYRGL